MNDPRLTDGGEDLPPGRAAVAERLANFESLLEVGVGRRPGVARTLAAAGREVTATDIDERSVPEGVRFVRDDIVTTAQRVADGEAVPDHYRVDAVYGLNLPPELHRPARDVARAAGADFLFTTLGGDEPAVAVHRESIGPETLFVAVERSGSARKRGD